MLGIYGKVLSRPPKDVVYVTIENRVFCLFLYLMAYILEARFSTLVPSLSKIKCLPIRTREIGGVRL